MIARLWCVTIVALLAIAPASAAPTRERPIEDTANAIAPADEAKLVDELVAMRATVEMAVIVVRTTGSTSIETYARNAGKQWASGKGPAAVLVLAIADRKSRLEVSDGLRSMFPDARAQSILDNSRGYLRSSDYAGAVRAIVNEVRAGAGGVAPDLESPHPQSPDVGSATGSDGLPHVPSVSPHVPTEIPEAAPTYQPEPPPKRSTPWAAILVIAGLVVLAGVLWAVATRSASATLSHDGVIHQRPMWVDVLWGIVKVIGGILWVVLMVAAASGNSNRSSQSSSSWSGRSSSGSSRSSSSSSGGGWSGGGASSGW